MTEKQELKQIKEIYYQWLGGWINSKVAISDIGHILNRYVYREVKNLEIKDMKTNETLFKADFAKVCEDKLK